MDDEHADGQAATDAAVDAEAGDGHDDATTGAGSSEGPAAEGLYTAYEAHARILRTWLVAYGIGGPVLFVNNDDLWRGLVESGTGRLVGLLFLAGVAVQVLVTAINKSAMWGSYYGEIEPRFRPTWRYRSAYWLGGQYWIDLLADVASLALFAAATIIVFKTVT
ncbi:MAG: hypothetical protein ACYTG1_02340 [Planctomycetota bacterium]|jgi:hypothetical protein